MYFVFICCYISDSLKFLVQIPQSEDAKLEKGEWYYSINEDEARC